RSIDQKRLTNLAGAARLYVTAPVTLELWFLEGQATIVNEFRTDRARVRYPNPAFVPAIPTPSRLWLSIRRRTDLLDLCSSKANCGWTTFRVANPGGSASAGASAGIVSPSVALSLAARPTDGEPRAQHAQDSCTEHQPSARTIR